MLRTLITIAAVAAFLALPAGALAMVGATGGTVAVVPGETPVNLLRDAKYLPAPKTLGAGTVQVVRVVNPGGFDFRDAGIGAALGAVALAVIGGLVIVLHHDHPAATPRTHAG
jgi:hypothetical protein